MANEPNSAYENQTILPMDITAEMKKSYINYAMSVIVARALPDVRDGLKPVHRRILYTMYEDGLTHDKPFRKAATTVGAVLGRYHPHGDSSVYDALVRMAQDFSLRYPLIDGHGNFGSIDGDPPAAYRYTEARMSQMASEMLREIERDTVDFIPNFDEQYQEPTVLASRLPTLLINGSAGIAVGMATNIPPHNLTEALNAAICLIDNGDATLSELMEHVQGPDFPTGGIIIGSAGIRAAYATGRGRCVVRGRTVIEEEHDRYRILITEIPYIVNKSRLVEQIADCVKDKRIEGISYLADESGRAGMKIRIDLKRDANPQVVLNQLYNYTQLQDSFSVNFLALVNGEPKLLGLRDALRHYIDFQIEIVERRTRFDLRKAEERAHLLEGLRIAVDNIDAVIHIIRTSYDNARERLMEAFSLSQVQAQAILEMQLRRLQGLERERIDNEYRELTEKISALRHLLEDSAALIAVVRDEMLALRDKYGDARRTDIEPIEDEVMYEDLIEKEDCVITRSHAGYIKRMPLTTYRSQRRGGKGVTGMTTREEDFVAEILMANTHSFLLFFTDKGKVYRLKGYQIPEAGRTAKGSNIVNLLPFEQGERITAVLHLPDFDKGFLTMATEQGKVKRAPLIDFSTVRKYGRIALGLEEGDRLVGVEVTDGADVLLLGTRLGKVICFSEADVRVMGRTASGVRGILLEAEDRVIGMCKQVENAQLLTVTVHGYGKRTHAEEYLRGSEESDERSPQRRGGKGLRNYNITEKTGEIAGLLMVDGNEDVMLVADDGIIIRMDAAEIPIYSRVTQGVRIMRLRDGVQLVTVTRTERDVGDDGESGYPM